MSSDLSASDTADPNNINQRILNPAAWQEVGAGQISAAAGLTAC